MNAPPPRCITYSKLPHNGTGWVQTCISILQNFPTDTLEALLVLPKSWVPISNRIHVIPAFPRWTLPIPYRHLVRFEQARVDSIFDKALEQHPSQVAYFWPSPPDYLVAHAKKKGSLTIREMINTPLSTAKAILEEAYDRAEVPLANGISEREVDLECQELHWYDYIFASNPCVEEALLKLGIKRSRILSSSFGWSPLRFGPKTRVPVKRKFRALFAGHVCVRKGVIQLIDAWKASGVDGELIFAGSVEPAIRDLISKKAQGSNVQFLGFVNELGDVYDSADIFVFPTLEEGGPQVTYEAAGRGLPVVTTPMGSARLVVNGRNGFVVQPYDVEGLAKAIWQLSTDADLRERLATQAIEDAEYFTYERVGASRAFQISDLLV